MSGLTNISCYSQKLHKTCVAIAWNQLREGSEGCNHFNILISLVMAEKLGIWDWQNHKRLNQFSNGNPVGSKINEVRYINEDDKDMTNR
jgi:hypothetical protein